MTISPKLRLIWICLTLLPGAALADNWVGGTSINWFTAANWDAGVPVAGTDVNINTGVFTPTIQGATASVANVFLGNGSGLSGTLEIQASGILNSNISNIGFDSTSTGTVFVDGIGSAWNATNTLYIGEAGTGSLFLTNGAKATAANSYIGFSGSGSGFASVDGVGSSWITTGNLIIGNTTNNTGSFNITNGGLVMDKDAIIANSSGATGDAEVSGTGSVWNNTNSLTVGQGGVANLTIFDNATVIVGGTQTVSIGADSNLNIGAQASNVAGVAGSLNAAQVNLTDSTSNVIFNHTTTNYMFNASITGSGAVVQQGSGTTIVTGNNTYTGGTLVSAGTLQGTTNGLHGNITNNSHVIFNQTDSGTFSGSISGTGDVSKNNVGTVIMNAANTYTGDTFINAGTLQIAADNNLGLATNPVTFGFDPTNPTAGRALAVSNTLAITRNIILNNDGTINTVGQNTQLTLSNITGPGSLIKTGEGSLVITKVQAYTGNTIVAQGTLKGAVKNTFINSPLLQIDNGGTFDLNGLQQTTNNLTNNGLITISNFVPGNTAYNQLRVQGNLSGAGSISISTDIVKVTGDFITVTGQSSGSQLLNITNDEQGVDPAAGTVLKVVQTTDGQAIFRGATDAGTFIYEVIPGDGSSATPDPTAFYLVQSPSHTLTNAANAAISLFSSGAYLYYSDLQTLVQRMGELRLGDNSGMWIRPYGNRMQISNQASRQFSQNIGGFDIGTDRGFNAAFGGHLNVGLFGGYLYAAQDYQGGGTGTVQGFSTGAYATWLHTQGWYVDLVAKYTQLWNNFQTTNSSQQTTTANYAIPTIGGSIETGRRFNFTRQSRHYFIEPQIQLETVYLDGKKYTASNGLYINADKQTSLQGRIGARTGMHFDFAHKKVLEPYLEASVIQAFVQNNNIVTNTSTFTTQYPSTVGKFSAGLTAQLAKSAFAYGEYDYAVGKGFREPVAISIGVRVVC